MCLPQIRRLTLYLDEEKRDGAMNMAIDEALLRVATHAVIRFYQWQAPTLSLGYFQCFEEVQRQGRDLSLVRRWTGGGMVFHGQDCTFSVIAPRGCSLASLTPAVSYECIHEGILRAFGREDMRLAQCEDRLSGAACFQSPALHDVLLASTKIAGGAQRRTRWGLLHQGSIQQVSVPEEFPARFAREFCEEMEMAPIPDTVLEAASRIAEERYGTREWLTKF